MYRRSRTAVLLALVAALAAVLALPGGLLAGAYGGGNATRLKSGGSRTILGPTT